MSSWKSILLRIGDKSSEYNSSDDFKDHIETCFGALRRELAHSSSEILSFLLQCAEQLPHKIPLYGTLIGLLNLEDEDFVKKIVEDTQNSFQDALDSANCDRIRISMRFLTALMCSKVLQPASLVVVFETLLSSAAITVDEEKGNPSWQARADFYVICILSCLPWGGAELAEQVPEEIERVLVGIQAYLSIRSHTSDSGLSFFEDDESGGDVVEKDFLEDLWERIQVLSNNGWKVESVPRPHLSFEAQLVAGKSHEFGPISCPEQPELPSTISAVAYGKQKHDAELKYPQRTRRLNIFPSSKTEDLQPIDRFVVEEYLLDVLLFFNGCRKECASFMVGLPVPFRYEYLMAETIFSQLLLLPHPPFKPIYYTLVIMDLCKALPGAFPAVVAGAVRALFDKIADLDMECRTRLILWFSHHLSNFQFIWPWDEWAYVLDLSKWAPQRVFVQEVLEREVRLSYWDKIKQSIENAPALEELLPPKGGPNFKYSGVNGQEKTEQEQAISSDLNNKVKGRQSAREIILWIEENVYPTHGLEITLSVVVQTLLDIGSKSFTHLITVLERYGQVIAKLCSNQDKQVMLIAEVSSYWKYNAQMTAIAIDRMMGYRLISNLAIVRWVFSPENVEQFHISDRPWEVLRNAVSKTYNRITDLRKEVSSLKKSIISAEEAASKAKADLEAAESKLALVEGEPVLGENPAKLKHLKSVADKAKEEEESMHDSLQAKEALLAQALDENEVLFLSLYKNFSTVLNKRLPDASGDATLQSLKSIHGDSMAVDLEELPTMEVDDENGIAQKSQSNGGKATNNVGEKEQWCLSTLGYVKTFSRQYASEIWPHIEKLDVEVLTEDAHPLFWKAVHSGLRRLSNEL
ncbi:Nuclear cap-binding protein subunit 1 [Hibiscus syriacus]|uniref:Nuclear cap-binding protein subunit 1 n=1 Tax=Hibiscus syriacus TaxID=106335 RepID=A0A6A2YJA0_HIBSY|nr:nuclear cap-binding protein subunit 1-like [Hibiscus syriacus]KAE8677217.1 Nuclear cap-binding protein subunit 1 [Hibiscus syriacus]